MYKTVCLDLKNIRLCTVNALVSLGVHFSFRLRMVRLINTEDPVSTESIRSQPFSQQNEFMLTKNYTF